MKASLFFLSSSIFINSRHAYIIPLDLQPSNQLTWNEAEYYCIDTYNTHLATIHSEYDWQAIIALTADFQATFWIGLMINISQPTSTTWSDGTRFNNIWTHPNDSFITHTNNTHCVTLYRWSLHPSDCDHKYLAICNGNASSIEVSAFHSSDSAKVMRHTSTNEQNADVMQMILNNEWLVFGLSLLIGFLAIGIMYCLIIVLCVSYLNIKTFKSNETNDANKDKAMDVDITITQHYEKEIILHEEGQLLTGVIKKHKFEYKQRTLKIPKSPRSKTKSPQSYNKSVQTSLNVRYPESMRSRVSCSEDVALMSREGSCYPMKDIVSTMDGLALDSSSIEYYPNVDNGRMTIGGIGTNSPEENNCLSADEAVIKENICSIGMNLKMMQNLNDDDDDDTDETEYYYYHQHDII